MEETGHNLKRPQLLTESVQPQKQHVPDLPLWDIAI